MLLTLLVMAVQLAEQPILPQGWTGLIFRGDLARLEHSSGATLNVARPRPSEDIDAHAYRTVERLASSLGFLRIGRPRHFIDSNQEWIEYDVRGNRLTERRRILYRAVRSETGFLEITYENSEERFDVLISEALSIVSSMESIRREERVRH